MVSTTQTCTNSITDDHDRLRMRPSRCQHSFHILRLDLASNILVADPAAFSLGHESCARANIVQIVLVLLLIL